MRSAVGTLYRVRTKKEDGERTRLTDTHLETALHQKNKATHKDGGQSEARELYIVGTDQAEQGGRGRARIRSPGSCRRRRREGPGGLVHGMLPSLCIERLADIASYHISCGWIVQSISSAF